MQGYVRDQLRVYLVDDHDLVRRGLRDLLTLHRDLVVVGESGSAGRARRAIPEVRPDVVVMDLMLQDGSGVPLCRAVRAADPSIKVLLLTSSGDDEALRATLLAGAAGYAVKLARSSDIVAAVRRVGDGRTLLDQHVINGATRRLHEDADRLDPPLSNDESDLLSQLLSGATDAQMAEAAGVPAETLAAEVGVTVERLMTPQR